MFHWKTLFNRREPPQSVETSRPNPDRDGGSDPEIFRAQVMDALRTVYDPEIPVNIVDLGLIYDVGVDSRRNVDIVMTLTAPNCPVAGAIPASVANAVKGVTDSVGEVSVELVWDPPWSKDRMSEEAQLQLGLI